MRETERSYRRVLILKMKVKKMNGEPLKSPKRKTLAIARKKKRNLNKIVTEQYLENYIDSNIYDSEIDKNTGMIKNIWICFIF